jgi:hypothetical protein
MFQLNADALLNSQELKTLLAWNAILLRKASLADDAEGQARLLVHRAVLKDSLIEALEAEGQERRGQGAA